MEEKIYFKPASYGKGNKKVETKPGENHKPLKLAIFLSATAVVIIIIVWLLHGKTTTTGQYPADIRTESLECTSNKLDYEKIGALDVSAVKKELELKLLFSGDSELKSISLRNSLVFNTAKEAAAAEAVTHAAFNKGLAARGYHSEKFENKFSIIDNQLVITIYNGSQLNNAEKDYFLLTSQENPETLQGFRMTYEAKGFACKTTEENN